jgi:hypothetical protein
MGKKLFTLRWARAVGAALTLAGAAIVFVVLFLPSGASARSTYCNIEPGGHRAASIKGFQFIDKAHDVFGDTDGSTESSFGYVAIYMSDASHVHEVWFKAAKGTSNVNGWVASSSVWGDSGANTLYAEVPDNAAKGKLRVNNSSDPNFCYVQTSKTFNP